MPRLMIYDFDGTLVDSERIVARVCLAAIHKIGLRDWTLERYIETFVGMPAPQGWARVEAVYGRPFPEGFRQAIDSEIEQEFETRLTTTPGAKEAIAAIPGARCIASSTEATLLKQNVGRAGLESFFPDAVFSASQVQRAKPFPDVFLFAAAQMGFGPHDCIVVEDSVPGVKAACAAGMTVFGYIGAAHAPHAMKERLEQAGCHHILPHMQDLPALLTGVAA